MLSRSRHNPFAYEPFGSTPVVNNTLPYLPGTYAGLSPRSRCDCGRACAPPLCKLHSFRPADFKPLCKQVQRRQSTTFFCFFSRCLPPTPFFFSFLPVYHYLNGDEQLNALTIRANALTPTNHLTITWNQMVMWKSCVNLPASQSKQKVIVCLWKRCELGKRADGEGSSFEQGEHLQCRNKVTKA